MKPIVSLLTSCSASGLGQLKSVYNKLGVNYVEVYAFMGADLDVIWPVTSVESGLARTSNREMAAAFPRKNEALRVARKVVDLLKPAKICAIATYIPEITMQEKNQTCIYDAQNSLCFLVDMVRSLQMLEQPVRTIEVVGGSIVDGIWRGKLNGGAETFVVNRKDPTLSLTRLAERLIPIGKYIVESGGGVQIALELEPGPLFNINGKESLLKFCYLIEEDPWLRQTTGFNLDVPHWCFLSRIQPSWLINHPKILCRIAHAHLSDHSSGHFSDGEPFLFHGAAEIGAWLRLLPEISKVQKESKSNIKYSGFLSCELECMGNEESIKRALINTTELVRRYC